MQSHKLKTLPKYFTEIENGNQSFELRKNDRAFNVGDLLLLQEYDGEEYTGRQIEKTISYLLSDFRVAWTVEEVKKLKIAEWVWIENTIDNKESAYFKKQPDLEKGAMFCCGYPGWGTGFYYAEYGKAWLAYSSKPDEYCVLSLKEPDFSSFITVDFAHRFMKYLQNNGWEIKKRNKERVIMGDLTSTLFLPISDTYNDFKSAVSKILDFIAKRKGFRVFKLIEEINNQDI